MASPALPVDTTVADDGWLDCSPATAAATEEREVKRARDEASPKFPLGDKGSLTTTTIKNNLDSAPLGIPEAEPPALGTPLDMGLMAQMFPAKDASKCEGWLQALLHQEFDTLEELGVLNDTGWNTLPLPLAVTSRIRQEIDQRAEAALVPPPPASPPALPALQELAPRLITQVDIIVMDVSMSMRSKSELDPSEAVEYYDGDRKFTMTAAKSNRRTREDISKVLFHTLVDKALVFELSHAIGLVAFGESVEPIGGGLTTAYESFHDHLGRLDANQGRTRLYDAIHTAAELVEAYCADHAATLAENAERRIFVLTDGEDNASTLEPWQLASSLQAKGIKLDAIPLGGSNRKLSAICSAAGGLCFNCVDQQHAIGLFEREATLVASCREPSREPSPTIDSAHTFQALSDALLQTEGGGAVADVRSVVSKAVLAPAVAPAAALAMMAAKQKKQEQKQAGSGSALGRAMKEYGKLLSAPPEGWRVFVSEEHPLSWKAVFSRGEPSAEWKQQVGECPYANGTWLLSVDIPSDYPFSAPKVRFVTPIFHCNVSVDGMICLSTLQEQWSPALTVHKALEAVRALLLSPDAANPLDAFKGQLFRDDKPMYIAEATKHTRTNAFEGFEVLAKRFQLQSAAAADAA